MRLCFLLVFMLFGLQSGLAKESRPTSFVLYYQPLHEFDPSQAEAYIKQLRVILSISEATQLHAQLLETQDKTKCHKNSYGPCSEVLYGTRSCVPKKTPPGKYCLRKSRNLNSSYFKEPLFNRIKWNRLSLKINKFCNFKAHNDCQALSRLHDRYMLSYRKMIQARKKLRKELRGQ